jgi:hypothetical protein
MYRILRFIKRSITPLLIAGLLVNGMPARAQDFSESVKKQFDQYSQKALQEKLYVHLNKTFYLAGEILWFKVYYVEGSSNKPFDLSKVAYVELLDKDNKPAMQAKVALQNGYGSGSLYIPSAVSAGNYTLRAYTQWMKNFSPDYYFEQPLTIVNSLKPLPVQSRDTSYRNTAGFFPEGGNLVAGINSKVAFQVTDPYGKGIAFTGTVVNQRNETVVNFQPAKFGMGQFSFTPAAGDSYTAVIKTENGQSFNKELPRIYEQGTVMQLQESPNGTITITVTSNAPASQQVFLLAQSRQVMKVAERKGLTNGSCSFTIDKNNLNDGISQFTLFNEQRQAVCERLYFKYPKKELAITASGNGQQYAIRQKVDFTVATAAAAKEDAANLSLSVYRVDSLPLQDQPGIFSYLWLSSDLKGTVESPEYYFSSRNADAIAAMDNLMMVHGWRRFNWDNVLNHPTASFDYVPEFDGHIITGKITRTETEAPIADTRTYLSMAGTRLQFYPVQSGPHGELRFDVRDYYGPGEIILQTDGQDTSYHIDIDNPYSEQYSQHAKAAFTLSPDLQHLLTEENLNMQVQNAYFSDRLSQFGIPVVDTIPFFGNGAKEYLLDDYVRFTTTEEILREYVPDVAVRRSDGHFKLYIFNWETEHHFNSSPLVLLDGVPVSIDKIMTYDPLKMRKLLVLTDRYVTGEFTYDGIISFTTYHGDLTELKLDTRALIMDYDGLQLQREFYSPAYETAEQKASRLPDFRNLLYWSPDVRTDQKGKATVSFFTSDLKGKYVAVLQGIDTDGNSGSYSFTFEVK